jgi:hypothetical protein
MHFSTAVDRAWALVARYFWRRTRKPAEDEIDAAFSKMAVDPDYQRDAITMACEFEASDGESIEAASCHQ